MAALANAGAAIGLFCKYFYIINIMNLRNIIFLIVMGSCLLACNNSNCFTFELAGDNTCELKKVLTFYSEKKEDSLKLKAAEFLIDNIGLHYTLTSNAIVGFADVLAGQDTLVAKHILNEWWKSEQEKGDDKVKIYDAQVLKADFLIENIEDAFETWINSSWKNSVSFSNFCQTILPYRFHEEPLVSGWRDSLKIKYSYLIRGENDIKKAYAKVYNAVLEEFPPQGVDFPHYVDVLKMQRMMRGRCIQRCIYIGSVMRSLGLPVAIDGVERWSNYSSRAHSWLSLVLDSGTYTVSEGDSIAKKCNPINSSTFAIDSAVNIDFPYDLHFKKRCVKIHRNTFEYIDKAFEDSEADENTRSRFLYPYYKDVSETYGYNKTLKIPSVSYADKAYLCIYATDKGWFPIAVSDKKNGNYVFENIGDSSVFILSYFDKGKMFTEGHPFKFFNNKVSYLDPLENERWEILVDRKYPLVGIFANRWAEMKGSRFEACDDEKFNSPHLLHIIDKTPIFMNEIKIDSERKYRYMRYIAHVDKAPQMAEIEMWLDDSLLHGRVYGDKVNDYQRAYDGSTISAMKRRKPGYEICVDFGKPCEISHIVYFPGNDDNFVVPNDIYQLSYYKDGWLLVGTQKSSGYNLLFIDVPRNALLRLTNKTKGNEVRIFTYEEGKQVWW